LSFQPGYRGYVVFTVMEVERLHFKLDRRGEVAVLTGQKGRGCSFNWTEGERLQF
jgi:hypothetical protein